MARFFITTLGCKVNQFESESISNSLTDAGWDVAADQRNADLCIINTCTVTGKASMQSRQAIRHIIRENPEARIIITGCYAQTGAEELREIEGVDDIISHADKHKIADLVLSGADNVTLDGAGSLVEKSCRETVFKSMPGIPCGNRTRPFLKIQDGCNAFCTYCIVPYARGRSRSMPFDDVIDTLKKLDRNGYLEAVLTGIHIGCYGMDLTPETSLYKLLRHIDETKPVRRIRLSSIEPAELTEDIIQLASTSETMANHFHIPLQSGDDTILKRMHRPYDSTLFRNLVTNICKKIPDCAVGVDTLIGFPGETGDEFQNTYELIKSLPMSYLHVFPFSPREGTPAANYPDQVAPEVLKQRCSVMRELGRSKKRDFVKRHEGRTLEVLIENKRDRITGMLKGSTSNYITVKTEGGDQFKNRMVSVRTEKMNPDLTLSGIIVD